MSNTVLHLARTAVLALTLASPALADARPGGTWGDGLVELDQPTALSLMMLGSIRFVGSDPDGTDYYTTASTGRIEYFVSGTTTTTVRGGDTGGRSGTDIVTGGTKSAS